MASPNLPPRPWTVVRWGGGQQIRDYNDDCFAEVVCYPLQREVDTSTLFAAAPALLEAAEKLLQAMRMQSKIHPSLMYTTPGWVELQRAINKAKGGAS